MPRNIISEKGAQGRIGQCKAMGGIEGSLWRARIAKRKKQIKTLPWLNVKSNRNFWKNLEEENK